MGDESRPPSLNYRGPEPLNYRGPPPRRIRVPEDAEAKRWRYGRLLFRVALVALGAEFAFDLGPNWFTFGQLTRPTPAYFVEIAETQGVPVVRAMKEYQRDTGRLPNGLGDLEPKYLPPDTWFRGFVGGAHFALLTTANHWVIYDFTPGAEGWRVEGPIANGPIPLPPVTIGPATRPVAPGK